MNSSQLSLVIEQAILNANLTAIKSAVSQLDQDYDITELHNQLEDLPGDIYSQRKTINSYRTQMRNLLKDLREKETALKSLENDLLLIITAETSPDTGKAKYSNDKARQAELNNRKKSDPEYMALDSQVRELRNQVDDLENLIAMAETDAERFQNMFAAVSKKVNMVCRQMDLIAAAMGAAGNSGQLAASLGILGTHSFGPKVNGEYGSGENVTPDTASTVGQAPGWDS